MDLQSPLKAKGAAPSALIFQPQIFPALRPGLLHACPSGLFAERGYFIGIGRGEVCACSRVLATNMGMRLLATQSEARSAGREHPRP
jgi:hypothetical protein